MGSSHAKFYFYITDSRGKPFDLRSSKSIKNLMMNESNSCLFPGFDAICSLSKPWLNIVSGNISRLMILYVGRYCRWILYDGKFS